MKFLQAASLLLLTSLAVPSHGTDLINGITDAADLCLDVGGIFDPSNPDQADSAARQDGVLCDTSLEGILGGNQLDVSAVAGFLPAGLKFSMQLGTECFNLDLVQDSVAGLTLLQLQNGKTCLDVIAAAGGAVFTPSAAAKICLGDTCNRRRNLLEDAVTLQQEDGLYRDISSKCAEHEYDVSLYVDSHMVAVASPKQDAIAAGCPFVATHSKYDHQSKKYEKEVFAWMDNHHVVDRAFNRDSYSIGTFKGSELAKAHESIDLSNHQDAEKAYDIITNNCASFMILLARQLDVKIGTKLTTFVARRLFESSSKDMVARIRNSVNFKSLFSGRNLRTAEEATTDRELIDLLVQKNTDGLI